MSIVAVTIDRLGAGGDGIGATDGTVLYIPYTVPGDRVRAALGNVRGGGREARVVERLADGPGRIQPPCPHFGTCGGCALQHVDDPSVVAWKRDQVVRAMAARGFGDAAVAPAIAAAPAARRRVSFALARAGGRPRVGLHPRFGTGVVDLGTCLIVQPALVALLAPLRAHLARLPGWRRGQAVATLTESGIDLVLALDLAPDSRALRGLAALAEDADLARLSLRSSPSTAPETIVLRRVPRVTFGGIAVDLPPGGFLQPTPEGEAAIAGLIGYAVTGRRRVADLYAGCGTWSLRLAGGAEVLAAEGDAALAAALRAAADRTQLTGRVRVETRDLAHRPLLAEDLARVDAVVFDPPRAGAARQVAEIARSKVPVVVAVSCNPATFARDARTLVDGGYRLGRITPVDQFLWSPHVELVAAFAR
ncbi:MAG: class I SAM-dependent RNA methyltransferase [Alphaproteobacteria bacterium]|nr:class I SAM-dependent RNA methyltransferase [Alphaproteobacteria bacterium]